MNKEYLEERFFIGPNTQLMDGVFMEHPVSWLEWLVLPEVKPDT